MHERLVYGQSLKFQDLLHRADEYARSSWPILIYGESGVGKELIAQRIHEKSPRASGKFVPLNCGALPAGLFESELFGHERGAFSGAIQGSRGLVRLAHQGTLFLDEIGELDLPLQVKLLRLLDRGEVRALGSTKVEHVDARIVAATNVDLYSAVRAKRFRWDLLGRISVLTLFVPPLRERLEDVKAICEFWLAEKKRVLTPPALERLLAFDWPGNIRQLRNVLMRAVALSAREIGPALMTKLLDEERRRSQGILETAVEGYPGSLADAEKRAILRTLKRWNGNRKEAAKELGIAKSTLHEKLRKWRETDVIPPCRGAVSTASPLLVPRTAGANAMAVRSLFESAAGYGTGETENPNRSQR